MKLTTLGAAATLSLCAFNASAADWPGAIVIDPGIYLIDAEDMTFTEDKWATCPGGKMPVIRSARGNQGWTWETEIYCEPRTVALAPRTVGAPGCQERPVIDLNVDRGRWQAWIRCPGSGLPIEAR